MLNEQIPMAPPHVSVTFDYLNDTHMPEYVQLQPEVEESRIRDRFRHGHTCFAARYEERLVAVAWATPHRIHMSYVSFVRPLPDKCIYFYESFTDPNYRNRSIQTALCTHMMRYFAGKGFLRVIAGVVPENMSSRRKNEKCGFRPLEMIRFVRLGPYRRLLPSISFLGD
jgi:RimJ/RimL family protein N-acetyltransferase